VTFADRTD